MLIKCDRANFYVLNTSFNTGLINKEDITWPHGDTNFIFESWKYLSRVSEANEWKILSAREDKIRIPARPCNILYLSNWFGKY